METLTIEVLGPGCSKCNYLEGRVRLALEDIKAEYPGVEGTIAKISDTNVFMQYRLMITPGLVINGKLVSAGRVAPQKVIADWMREALETAS